MEQYPDKALRFLQDGKRHTLKEICSAIGCGNRPYREVLGPLDADGKLEFFGERNQWNQERGEVDWSCESVRLKRDYIGVVSR